MKWEVEIERGQNEKDQLEKTKTASKEKKSE